MLRSPTRTSTAAASVATVPRVVGPNELLRARYSRVRTRTTALAASLSPEDAMVQSMDDASPAKWHLAHTTWFFERFVLGAREGYVSVDARWDFLFNSYYNAVGPMHARPRRGVLSRPTLAEVMDYRAEIDARISRAFDANTLDIHAQRVLLLGTHHEQQHQELLLTDIKHAFFSNPTAPAYRTSVPAPSGSAQPLRWLRQHEAIVALGAAAWPQHDAFAFDSESPVHRVLVQAHALASRPVSNAEYAAFIEDGGYRNASLWLSDGWAQLRARDTQRPLYWHPDGMREFTLGGWRERDPHAPACHLSYFEADAFARWAGARLPTEAEWECAAAAMPVDGNFLESGLLHPSSARAADQGNAHGIGGSASARPRSGSAPAAPATDGEPTAAQPVSHHGASDQPEASCAQLFGDVWEWTSSAYTAYPGFRALDGALGEYNGKFMNGQWVLRGGSCLSPRDHLRASYRNFFPPSARWQCAGVRLARDCP